MVQVEKEFFYDEDSGRILGIIAKDSTSWLAQTIFGYTIERTASRADAERVLFERGLSSLRGVWQYLDPDEKEWFPCVIQEASEKKVVAVRTDESGLQTPENYKRVVLMNPTDEVLMRMS